MPPSVPSWTTLILAVAIGGAAGSLTRFGVAEWFKVREWSTGFPWHTFAVNVLGSFLLGLLAGWCREPDRQSWLALGGTGFCGGFTTFSTFSLETVSLLESNRLAAAAGYVGGTLISAVAGVWIGLKLTR